MTLELALIVLANCLPGIFLFLAFRKQQRAFEAQMLADEERRRADQLARIR